MSPAHLSSLLNGKKRNYAAPLKLYFNFSSSQFMRLTIIIRLFLTSNSRPTSFVYFFYEGSSVILEHAHSEYRFTFMNHHLSGDGFSPLVHSYFVKMICLSND